MLASYMDIRLYVMNMSMHSFITPNIAKAKVPLEQASFIHEARDKIRHILFGDDPRLLLIVGPCSIHSQQSAIEYAKRLQKLSTEVDDVFFIIMRTYFEKPRTSFGWKGLLYDPFIDGSDDMQEGILLTRKILQEITSLGLATATEFLEPLAASYISDCISWGSIGARTCQSPIHRQLASSLAMPLGFKNRNDGNIEVAIQAILASQQKHHYLGINDDGVVAQLEGQGNPFTHLVLRGSIDRPNCDPASIHGALEALKKAHLAQKLIVDCSHDNSQKNYRQQALNFRSLIDFASGQNCLRGIMLESFLHAGTQGSFISKELGASLTDPCLDWQTTEELIQQGASVLRQKVISCV